MANSSFISSSEPIGFGTTESYKWFNAIALVVDQKRFQKNENLAYSDITSFCNKGFTKTL
jgi:hypothetical protein